MNRIIFWGLIHLLMLKTRDIEVRYTDGQSIYFSGWWDQRKRRTEQAARRQKMRHVHVLNEALKRIYLMAQRWRHDDDARGLDMARAYVDATNAYCAKAGLYGHPVARALKTCAMLLRNDIRVKWNSRDPANLLFLVTQSEGWVPSGVIAIGSSVNENGAREVNIPDRQVAARLLEGMPLYDVEGTKSIAIGSNALMYESSVAIGTRIGYHSSEELA